jgi:cytochrome P450
MFTKVCLFSGHYQGRSALNDNVDAGYHFTRDTVFFANTWHILHDETLYPDPFTFNPDRFIRPAKDEQTEKLRDPFAYAFGYGRRICPGMYLAMDSMFLTIAMSLATLNIEKKKDANGQYIEPRVEYTSGIVRQVFHVARSAVAILVS